MGTRVPEWLPFQASLVPGLAPLSFSLMLVLPLSLDRHCPFHLMWSSTPFPRASTSIGPSMDDLFASLLPS